MEQKKKIPLFHGVDLGDGGSFLKSGIFFGRVFFFFKMLSERAEFCCMIVSIFVIVGLLTESRRSDSCKDETRAPRDRLGESFSCSSTRP